MKVEDTERGINQSLVAVKNNLMSSELATSERIKQATVFVNAMITSFEDQNKKIEQSIPGESKTSMLLAAAIAVSFTSIIFAPPLAAGAAIVVSGGSFLYNKHADKEIQKEIHTTKRAKIKLNLKKCEIIRELIATMNNCYREKLKQEAQLKINEAKKGTFFNFIPNSAKEIGDCCVKSAISISAMGVIFAIMWFIMFRMGTGNDPNINFSSPASPDDYTPPRMGFN